MSKVIAASHKKARLTSKTRVRRVGKSATLQSPSGERAIRVVTISGVKTKTLRLVPQHEAALSLFKRVFRKPINKMVNEAVGEYIQKRATEVEVDLTGVLEQIKAYRRADPHFEEALAQFVNAEARHGGDDPVEGVVVDVEPPKDVLKSKVGPTQTIVRNLLKADS